MKVKFLSIIAIALMIFVVLSGCKKDGQTTAPKKSSEDLKAKVSYLIGFGQGESLKKSKMDGEIDTTIFIKGIKDGLKGVENKYKQDEIQKISEEFTAYMTEKMKVEAEKRPKDNAIFLAANKTKKGVITTPSGLQYKIIKEGTGPIPKATDSVKTNYIGKLVDGTEFDSTIKRGEPAVFPVTGVIPGWTEALQLMKVGSKWELYIPSELAYGDQDNQTIPANSILIFELELLSIEQTPTNPVQ